MRNRAAPTAFKWVKGHDGVKGNEQCDRLAKAGAALPIPDVLNLDIPDNFNVQGAKLSELTQTTAYRGIRSGRPPYHRPTSLGNILLVREAIMRYTGTDETDASIWLSIRKKPIHPKISQFLFKAIHGTFMIGDFWSHIQAVEDRRLCTVCGTTESMSHILVQCQCRPTQVIWNLTRDIWPYNNIPWPDINLGTILGCGCLSPPQPANQERPHRDMRRCGASHLLQILLSESAFLIWVLCCERVIQERGHNDQEIRARWLRTINTRLTDNKIIATKLKRNKGFTNLVVSTWEHVLKKERDLPNNWINLREVLVGSGVR